MKNFFKKNWTKLLICMSISFAFIFSFAFMPKTYAQEHLNNGYEILPNGIISKNLYDGATAVNSSGDTYAIFIAPETKQYTFSIENIVDRINVDYPPGVLYQGVYNTNKITFNATQNSSYRIYVNNGDWNGILDQNEIMINEGSYALNYFPYGSFNGDNNYDWNNDLLQENERLKVENDSLKNINFMDYLIGQNYFTEGKIEYRQTTNGTWWDRKLLNSNSSTNSYIGNNNINNYIEGKQLNISSAYNDLLNSSSSVVLGRFSEIMIFPSLSLKSSSWNYLSVEARYINIDIYAPNFSGQCRAILSDNGLYNDETSPNLTIVDFTKNGDYFNIRFDSDNLNYLCYIEFSLPYNSSSQTYQSPNFAISNTKDTTTWNLYNLGYDDGYNAQRGEIEGLKSNLESANTSVNVLKQRVNDLQEQVNNNFGFKNVFFAMADTPFKTVSNFLGFELFGINLFQALIGFITVLACIWLIKKLI